MVKEEWGTKRTCPKCGERFYDLGNADPVTCIECGTEWAPEPILKSKQPIIAVEQVEKKAEKEESEDLDLEVDVDIDDNDDPILGDVSLDDDDDVEVTGMVDTSLSSDGDES
ncbi:TIGR02300 family protein [Temperatibacter marinus]|uniref:TIGR02300 family protein n=1 Tax=Temperatibacter marinus TaxID=1456591 RepID=A0AA52EHP0_9PROT|nr:TIGR02300 family protein [Temperatibacter marinus]WND03838.1 TIGR02300 family protein [Temperatibacter marinus]